MYWFILGHEPLLSAAELVAVFGLRDYAIDGKILRAEIAALNAGEAMARLGGTIKIGVELGGDLTEGELVKKMITSAGAVEGKIHFGISLYGGPEKNDIRAMRQVENWGKKVKGALKLANRSARFVFNREVVLSSASVAKNGLDRRGREFMILPLMTPPATASAAIIPNKLGGGVSSPRYRLGQTIAVQPFEDFSSRDYGRPGRDDASGMLPPKLAMMMLNISGAKTKATILDPFCGSGTIVTEAMLLGYEKIIGSDISDKAVSDTRANIDWLKQKNPDTTNDITTFTANAAELSQKIPAESIDAIITEPYLGRPLRGRETEKELRAQADELKTLYAAAFSELAKLLKPNGAAVFVIPRFRYKNTWITIDCAEAIKKAGLVAAPLLPRHDFLVYARANQFVGREIRKLTKQ